jgi:hypothetical protein
MQYYLQAIVILFVAAMTALPVPAQSKDPSRGNCGAPNGGGPNSTNYYSKGDPCAYSYAVPAERLSQLLSENNFCTMFSRTEVNCSQPAKGNYGQQRIDRTGMDRGQNRGSIAGVSPRSELPAGVSTGRSPADTCISQSNAVQQNPKDANAYITRAVCYMTFGPNDRKPPLKNMEAAVKDLETAIKLAPRNFFAHHNYAHAAYLLGYDNFAVYEFNKAIALNPNSGRSYMGRGFAYLEECNFKAAPPDLQKAVSLDPSLRSKVATEQEFARHREQCTARPVPPPNFRATPGTDQYLDHNSDYWRLRTWEERPH